jgi:hypothetical protein
MHEPRRQSKAHPAEGGATPVRGKRDEPVRISEVIQRLLRELGFDGREAALADAASAVAHENYVSEPKFETLCKLAKEAQSWARARWDAQQVGVIQPHISVAAIYVYTLSETLLSVLAASKEVVSHGHPGSCAIHREYPCNCGIQGLAAACGVEDPETGLVPPQSKTGAG